MPAPCRVLVLVLLGIAAGCAPSAATLDSGVVHVRFTTEETCGFSNPYTVEARGCRRLDEKAVMCKGFGVIDGVLFAGGCEAPAELELLETQGTMPLSPPRSAPAPEGNTTATAAPEPASEPFQAGEEPAPKPEKKARASSKKSKTKKSARRKKRQ